MSKNKVVYKGAIEAFMNGGNAAFAPLIPHLPKKADRLHSGMDDNLSSAIFRAYDIRGIFGETLSAKIAYLIGHAIGSEAQNLKQQYIVVARDGRLSSPELNVGLIAGLRASGCDVINIGIAPTPLMYFSTHHLQTGSGVMITGSHNSAEYNGFKIMLAGQTLFGDAIKALYQRIIDNDLTCGQGNLRTADISSDYLHRIKGDILEHSADRKFKIVVDCGNGVTGQLAPQLYRSLGHDVVELFCEADGRFPNHPPDPSQPDNLQDLITTVKIEKADLGLAFDGDGDRLAVVDNQGNIILPDKQMMLFVKDVLSRNQNAYIVFDVKCSRNLQSVIEQHGGKPLMWKSGHSFIKAKMQAVDAPLAGELSGHIFFKERWYGFDDGLYAGARMLEILTHSEHSPSEVFAGLPNSKATEDIRIPLDDDKHIEMMQMIKENIAFTNAKITEIDGIRVDFPYGWGVLRTSNTGPFLTARFEAENDEMLDRIKKDFRDLIYSTTIHPPLPF